MQKTYQTSAKVKQHLYEVIGFLVISAIILITSVSYQRITELKASYEALVRLNEAQTEAINSLETELDDLHVELNNLHDECKAMREALDKLSSKIVNAESANQHSNERIAHEEFVDWVKDICQDYQNVDPAVILAVIEAESSFNPNASNGRNLGLMQIDPKWHSERAERLGVTDWFDPIGSIRLGVDYLSEIDNEIYKVRGFHDLQLTLMVYNMGYSKANKLYDSGDISNYATRIIASSELWQRNM